MMMLDWMFDEDVYVYGLFSFFSFCYSKIGTTTTTTNDTNNAHIVIIVVQLVVVVEEETNAYSDDLITASSSVGGEPSPPLELFELFVSLDDDVPPILTLRLPATEAEFPAFPDFDLPDDPDLPPLPPLLPLDVDGLLDGRPLNLLLLPRADGRLLLSTPIVVGRGDVVGVGVVVDAGTVTGSDKKEMGDGVGTDRDMGDGVGAAGRTGTTGVSVTPAAMESSSRTTVVVSVVVVT
mmetsp:Transcript_26169/g.29762  ORF Transcript_26169/g.29762 Transcript_26169/m.29762 type:complete len:236 (+) Transcript_26169:345-1052(+)